MINKGLIGWAVIFAILLIAGSFIIARFLIHKNIVYEKRLLEEKILSTGNEIETYSHLISSSSYLATIQALHDIGFNVILDEAYDYGEDNLPYWSSIPKEEIKNKVSDLSKTYFNNYIKDYSDYFEGKNEEQYSVMRGITWSLEWDPEMRTDFNGDSVEIGFGEITLSYRSNEIDYIKRDFPVKSKINTKFSEILSIGQDVVNKIENKYEPGSYTDEMWCCMGEPPVSVTGWRDSPCKGGSFYEGVCIDAGAGSCSEYCSANFGGVGYLDSLEITCVCEVGDLLHQDELNEIKNNPEIKIEGINIKLEKEENHVLVEITEEESYHVYDPLMDDVKEDNLGLKFLIDLDGSPKIGIDEMDDVQRCGSWIVRTTNNDICSMFLVE